MRGKGLYPFLRAEGARRVVEAEAFLIILPLRRGHNPVSD